MLSHSVVPQDLRPMEVAVPRQNRQQDSTSCQQSQDSTWGGQCSWQEVPSFSWVCRPQCKVISTFFLITLFPAHWFTGRVQGSWTAILNRMKEQWLAKAWLPRLMRDDHGKHTQNFSSSSWGSHLASSSLLKAQTKMSWDEVNFFYRGTHDSAF